MEVRFHKRVQFDLNTSLKEYYDIKRELGNDFYDEFIQRVKIASSNPRYYHFDDSGLRRCNLEKFPYHFLYDVYDKSIRIWVLRHDGRKPSYGLKRFRG